MMTCQKMMNDGKQKIFFYLNDTIKMRWFRKPMHLFCFYYKKVLAIEWGCVLVSQLVGSQSA